MRMLAVAIAEIRLGVAQVDAGAAVKLSTLPGRRG
jgi:hypothetical protein